MKKYGIVLILSIMISIGFAQTNITGEIQGTAVALSNRNIEIIGVTCDKEIIETHDKTILTSRIELENEPITCTIKIRNNTLENYAFESIVYSEEFYDNNEIEITTTTQKYEKLNKNQTLDINITYKYKEEQTTNNILNSTINFKFKKYYNITYENIENNYPEIVLENESLELTLSNITKLEVEGTNNYTYQNNILTINNITKDIKIKNINKKIAYFLEYDGSQNILTFDRTIKNFKRNTSLTEQEVRQKQNVKLIHNISEDEYNSEYKIYGWVENEVLYWWSEAELVYFHPKTIKAFNIGLSITEIDLTDTSTEKVENFSHWFDTNKNLKTIKGTLITTGLKLEYNENYNYKESTNNDTSSEKGMAFMFNDCNSLEQIDLSGFITTNASDMKRMFGGCKKITTLDLSNFDTKNVKSMHWMFRQDEKLTQLDLTSFDTRNVENMFGMFVQATGIKNIIFGEKFDTSKVKYMTNMFYGMKNLTTIYAKQDFIRNNTTSQNMFYNDTKLVGAKDKMYETQFNSSKIDATYAQIANANQLGYFTYLSNDMEYTITYDLDGGTAINPIKYTEQDAITLNPPIKTGYTFIGWTGSNGITPQENVTIQNEIGNKNYKANYTKNTYIVKFNPNSGTGEMNSQLFTYDEFQKLNKNTFTNNQPFRTWNTKQDGTGTSYNDEENVMNIIESGEITLYAQWGEYIETFPKVFVVEGPCTFNGSENNITGEKCEEYTNQKYINTNIYLFSNENIEKDFEIYFEINDYNPSNQQTDVTQQTIMNSKLENQTLGYPGFVFRRAGNNLELKTTTQSYSVNYRNIQTVKIIRRNKIIYYSINNNQENMLHDISDMPSFNVPVWFGASMDVNGNPFRHVKATISKIYIKLGQYHQ